MAGKTFADDEQPLLNEQKPKSSLTRVAVLAVACSLVDGIRGGDGRGLDGRLPLVRRYVRGRLPSPPPALRRRTSLYFGRAQCIKPSSDSSCPP